MSRILHIDIETTGTNPFAHGIHRIAGEFEIDGKILSHFDLKVRPHANAVISDKALEVGGVTLAEIRKYDNADFIFQTFMTTLRVFITEDPATRFFICAYNAGAMEVPFLREWYKNNRSDMFNVHFFSGFLDTMSLACNYCINHGINIPNYSLSSVAAALGIKVDASQLHLPGYDAKISRLIYHKINQ